jgi:hypothetical protein
MPLQKKEVLVTVKTYPNPSTKYRETVCVAGIDMKTRQWIRLYPIPFRDLNAYQQFKKYSLISINTEKAADDKRPESYKVDSDSISILERINTEKGSWNKRKEILLPTKSESFCSILDERIKADTSLGMFKPTDVKFVVTKAKPKDILERKECYNKLDLFYSPTEPIEPIPFDFRYTFSCADAPDCPGHDLRIIDWEIYQSYRSWRWKYKSETELLEKIEQKWLDGMCSAKKDTYFFVGNTKRFRDTFMVLGVFYPPQK